MADNSNFVKEFGLYIEGDTLKYSGRNTSHQHKCAEQHAAKANMSLESWIAQNQEAVDCIQTEIVFNAQWTNCPIEVEKEVRELWQDHELGNDGFYHYWDSDDQKVAERYPVIAEYLKFRGIDQCKIHWWW